MAAGGREIGEGTVRLRLDGAGDDEELAKAAGEQAHRDEPLREVLRPVGERGDEDGASLLRFIAERDPALAGVVRRHVGLLSLPEQTPGRASRYGRRKGPQRLSRPCACWWRERDSNPRPSVVTRLKTAGPSAGCGAPGRPRPPSLPPRPNPAPFT